MRALLAFLGAAVAGALVSCSFTTAGNFTECAADVDCGSLSACSSGYCLSLPEGCRRENAGGATEPFSEGDRIPLAAILKLTDDQGEPDNSELRGLDAIRLAVSEVNDNRGVSNRHFALFVCDTGRDGKALTRQLEWMVKNLEVPAVLTSGSDQTQDAAKNPVRLEAGTLVMSATATSAALVSTFEVQGNVWRVAPPDTLQARVMLELVRMDYPDAGGSRIDTVFETTEYGRGLGQAVGDSLEATGYPTGGRRDYPRGDTTEISSKVTQMTNNGTLAVVLVAFPPDVKAYVTAAQTYPNLTRDGGFRWYLTDAAKDPDVLSPASRGPLEGTLGTAPAQGAGGAFSAFRDSFRGRYQNTDPLSFSFTSHSYDAAWLVMLSAAWASQRGGAITGPRMGEGMSRLQAAQPPVPLRADKWLEASNNLSQGNAINIEGTSGALDFDLDAGAAISPYEIWQISDGGIRVLRLVTP